MCLKNDLNEYKDNRKKIIFQLSCLLILIVVAVVFMIVSFFRATQKTKQEVQNLEYENETVYVQNIDLYFTEGEKEDVPNFGTILTNMERFAVPMLEDDSYILEKALIEFLPELKTAEIFYVLIPEDDKDVVEFYVRSNDVDDILILSFSWSEKDVKVSWSEYNEQEIISEAWNGDLPECRDEEE